MTATFRAPLADFRLSNYPSTAAQAIVTCTGGTDTINFPTGGTYSRIPVVMNISGEVATAATAQTPIALQLIDGTAGGTATNIVRQWALACAADGMAAVHEGNLNIPCLSGNATLQFSGTSVANSQQSVNISGYIKDYSNS